MASIVERPLDPPEFTADRSDEYLGHCPECREAVYDCMHFHLEGDFAYHTSCWEELPSCAWCERTIADDAIPVRLEDGAHPGFIPGEHRILLHPRCLPEFFSEMDLEIEAEEA